VARKLVRATGHAQPTCRRALHDLLKDGILVPGPSPNSRLRIATADRVPDPGDALSAALAARRHAAGLTQSELAALVGRSVTAVGHAETGRLWQSRAFWENADKALSVHGELLRAHDAYRAGVTAGPAPAPNTKGDIAMNDQLRKRMLAVNVLLEVPEDIPDGLESELYCYRDKLEAEALSP
jgi:transcriptional regulator with XRE-family HTH domain